MQRSFFWFDLALLAILLVANTTVAVEHGTAPPVDHSRLMVYWTPDGKEHPVQDARDWAVRRRQILLGMEMVMGELPDRSKRPPPEVNVLGQREGDGFLRLEITYLAAADENVPAYLLLPKDRPPGNRLPAMLALHQTTALEKKEVAGEGGLPNLAYAKELAQRGYVVLAPDYPSLGDYAYEFIDRTFQHTPSRQVP
jgi:hypothetical protein